MAIDIGTGTSIAFATDAITLGVVSLKAGGVSVPEVDTTVLNPTLPTGSQEGAATSMPGKVQKLGGITVEVQHEGGSAKRVKLRTVQTITITYPDSSTYSGSGYIHSKGPVDFNKDGLLVQTLEIAQTGIWS